MTPCDWEPLYSDCDCEGTCCHLGGMSPAMTNAVVASATTWLWEATNRRFGNCPVTILPCLKRCGSSAYGIGGWGYPWIPFRSDSGWINIGCGSCGESCSCTSLSSIVLPTAGTVLEITEDGVTLDPAAWITYNNRELVRVDGESWPPCQDFTASPPTWTISYVPGLPVPEMGQIALGSLICQMARRVCGVTCDLPANATQVTRQGVSIKLDPTTQSGLWLVDQWVAMANRPLARVWSPDVAQPRILSV